MKHPSKIIIVDRFAPLRANLLTLLADLGEDDWARPTAAPRWSVKDVASHLLGGDVAILSGKRDGFRNPQRIESNDQLLDADRYNSIIIAVRHGVPVTLGSLGAAVEDVGLWVDQEARASRPRWQRSTPGAR